MKMTTFTKVPSSAVAAQILILAGLFSGCGPAADAPEDTPPDRGIDAGVIARTDAGARATCTTSDDCGGGLPCTSGVCVAPLPTASQYRACSIDVDCPSGDHCDLGACTHDCVSDRDCSSGNTCDLRGRCATPAMANQPPPPAPPTATAPVLHVDDEQLEFATFSESKTITLRNTGDSPFDFRILANKEWLAAQPVTGTVEGGAAMKVTVSVQRTGVGTQGSVSVVSTGGTASVRVSIPAALAGLYQGEVHITSPSDLGARQLAIGMVEQPTGTLQGVVDDARSPAFGFRAALDPSSVVSGRSVTVKFVIPARKGSGANPSYPANLLRTITIAGTIGAGGGISGTFTEALDGVLSVPVILTGTVTLAPIDRAAPLLPSQTDTVDVRAPIAPSFLACDICPSGTCPANHVEAGQQFLGAAFKFYKSPLAEGTGDAYAPIRSCVQSTGNCYDPIALHCAQAHFYRAIQSGGSHDCRDLGTGDCAERGLLDTFKGLLAWNSLYGNEHLVSAYEPGQSLDMQRAELGTARSAFAAGYLGASTGGARVWGILDPFFLNWIAGLPVSTWSSPQLSLLQEGLQVGADPSTSKTVAPYGDFARLGSDIGLWIEALKNELAAQHRLNANNPQDLVLQAGRDVADAHVALALAGALQARMGTTDKLTAAVGHAADLANKAREIESGLNPAGYSDQYIAYTYTPALKDMSNNYLKLMDDFTNNWLSSADRGATDAHATTREFESSIQALTQQLVQVNADNGKRIVDLCGGSARRPSIVDCGKSDGQVFDTTQQIQSALLRLQNATSAVAAQYEQIEIEQNRAAQQASLHKVEASAILADGSRLRVLQTREMILDEVQSAARGLADAIGSGNLLKGISGGAASIVDGIVIGLKYKIDQERLEIESMAKARVEYDQAQEQLIDSAARVKTLLLEIPTLRINALLAEQDIGRLVAQLNAQLQDAKDTAASMSLMQQLSKTDPRRDPAFRQYRDEATVLSNKAFDAAQGQLFLVTRAFEYEVGMSFWRRGELFTLVSPEQLRAYKADLERAYQKFIATVGNSQEREVTLSLRDQIFRFSAPLVDNATGGTYAPEDIFHHLLADPRNRDADGNVRLTFAFPLTPDAPTFNHSFCTDKITGIRISLVGASLGATQPEVGLQQRGSAYLRSCTDTDNAGEYAVSSYNLENTIGVRRAIVQAGLNLSGPSDMSSGGPDNTEFYGRPVAAPYELIIDRNVPANANLDLTKLDDIILFIKHETRTVH
jgi:hypothetical protein